MQVVGNGIMCLHILDVDRRTGEYRVSNLPPLLGDTPLKDGLIPDVFH